jgi:Cathepsin propeptide inhibitor domain (I29)
VYATKSEHENKYSIFKENYEQMLKHNSQEAPFKLGINRFSDMSDEEFEGIYLK